MMQFLNVNRLMNFINQLSLAEKLFLYELKKDANFEELYIIQNLFNFRQR